MQLKHSFQCNDQYVTLPHVYDIIIILLYKQGGSLCSPPAAPDLYFPSCNYIPACATECHKHSCERADLAATIIIYKITCMMLHHCVHCSIATHVHLLHPVRAHDLINRLAKKLVSSLAISPTACVKARSKERNLLPP